MSRPFIVVGDRTSHGGVVISGSESTEVDGKPVARVGDRVTCPKKGHGSVTTIVTGDVTAIIDGRPLARHGDKTACGAMLISSQMIAVVDEGSSAGQDASSAPAGPAGTSSLMGNEAKHAYDLQFLVQGDKSGKPMANTPYKIMLDDGRDFFGKTDKNGLTQKVGADYPAQATLIAPYHDDDTNTDGYCGIDACCC